MNFGIKSGRRQKTLYPNPENVTEPIKSTNTSREKVTGNKTLKAGGARHPVPEVTKDGKQLPRIRVKGTQTKKKKKRGCMKTEEGREDVFGRKPAVGEPKVDKPSRRSPRNSFDKNSVGSVGQNKPVEKGRKNQGAGCAKMERGGPQQKEQTQERNKRRVQQEKKECAVDASQSGRNGGGAERKKDG